MSWNSTVIALPLLDQLKEEGTEQDLRRHHRRQPRLPGRPRQGAAAHQGPDRGAGQDARRRSQGAGGARPQDGHDAAVRVRQAARRPDPGAGQEGSREGQARARPGAGAARALPDLARLRGQAPHRPVGRTVKADAARNAFGAFGRRHRLGGARFGHRRQPSALPDRTTTSSSPAPLQHRDFTTGGESRWHGIEGAALTDENGHGTHVAGIIAGELTAGRDADGAGRDHGDRRTGRTSTARSLQEEREIEADLGHGAAVQAGQPQGAGRGRRGAGRATSSRACEHDPGDQRLRPPHPGPRRQHERRLRLRAGVVRLRPEPALRRGRPPGALGRGRRGRRRQHRLRLRPDARSAARSPPGWTYDQRPGQRRARDHGRLDPPRHAARLRRLLLLLQGPDRRRPAQARPGRAGREDHLLRRRGEPRGGSAARPQARPTRSPRLRARTAAPAWRRRTCPA